LVLGLVELEAWAFLIDLGCIPPPALSGSGSRVEGWPALLSA